MDGVLFDGKGRPVAYLETDGERIIYLWGGHAVAYFVGDRIYGWNGNHLGWYSEGVVYDVRGQRVGSIGDKCPRALQAERVKAAKRARPAKFARLPEHKRPDLRKNYSEQDFEEFLKEGASISDAGKVADGGIDPADSPQHSP
jgi:hypothetical protein